MILFISFALLALFSCTVAQSDLSSRGLSRVRYFDNTSEKVLSGITLRTGLLRTIDVPDNEVDVIFKVLRNSGTENECVRVWCHGDFEGIPNYVSVEDFRERAPCVAPGKYTTMRCVKSQPGAGAVPKIAPGGGRLAIKVEAPFADTIIRLVVDRVQRAADAFTSIETVVIYDFKNTVFRVPPLFVDGTNFGVTLPGSITGGSGVTPPAAGGVTGGFSFTIEGLTGNTLADTFTCRGNAGNPRINNPAITFSNIPAGTTGFSILFTNDNAGNFIQWSVPNAPARNILNGETRTGTLGTENSTGTFPGAVGSFVGYGAPCAPAGETHTYRFVVTALPSNTQVTSLIVYTGL